MMLRRSMAFSQVVFGSAFPILAVVLALVAIVILMLRFAEKPQMLAIAVGPADGEDAQLIAAISRRLERDGAKVRFSIRAVAGPEESAKALEDASADLAVIRTDVAIPPNGATVVVLHTDIVALAAPRTSALAKVGELSGKRVGIFPATAANAALLDALLAEYDIVPATVQHVMLSAEDLPTLISDKRADAIFAVGAMRSPPIEAAIAALVSRKHDPVLIAIDAAAGMAARSPAYQKVDVPQGFFPGSPPLPKDDLATLAVAYRLEARQSLSEEVVTNLTKRLFAMRRSLQQEAPIAIAIDKPDTDKGSQDAVHPGAAAYYGDNEKSFMDLYGDWIYIAAMGFSGLGSGLAAMFSVTRARARRSALALIDQLIDLKQMAHTTTSPARLSELESGIEDLSTKGLRFARDHNFDEAGLAALRLAIDEARRAVDDQYNVLQDKPALITNAASARSPIGSVPSPES
ncbi:MAG: TAXI family TRAP transporter solute-binding subunit [Methylocella sp.]